jgi:hypothetical protein
MRTWVKRLLATVLLLILGIAAVAYGGFRMFKGAPAWYRRPLSSAGERELLARRAFNKFANIQNAAALARQDQLEAGATVLPAAPIAVTFSDDELNAFFEKWESYANWKSNYDRYFDNPLILIEDRHLVLAAGVKDLGSVISVGFDPRMDSAGKLRLELDRVQAGQLPMPGVVTEPYRQRLESTLRASLPRWEGAAAVNPDGAANVSLISAAMAKLCLHMLAHEPAEPLLFLPLVQRRANVPVRILDIRLEDHTVNLLVRPLDLRERAALVAQVRDDR